MKILQVCPKFHQSVASGSTKVAYDISRELVKRGHSVTVYSSNMRDKFDKVSNRLETKDGMLIHRFRSIGTVATRGMKIFVTPGIIPRFGSEVSSFDVIHLHEYQTFQNLIAYHYARKHDVPYVLHAHGSIPRIGKRFRKWLFDVAFGYRLLKGASRVIALSVIEAKEYEDAGVPREKIAIIPDGIDLTDCKTLPHRGSFRKRFGIEEGTRIILFLGRINHLKGIDFLIDAFARVVKNMEHNVLLVVAGPDDGYLNETKKLVKQHLIQDKVLLTGPLFGVRKMEAYVDASIVTSLDSLKEIVFLLVPLEAAACGTPVIVTEGNYIAELAEKGGFGSCVEYGDVSKLAGMFKEMLGNEGLLKKMGSKGRSFVLENYDWNNIIGMVEKVYKDALEQSRGRERSF